MQSMQDAPNEMLRICLERHAAEASTSSSKENEQANEVEIEETDKEESDKSENESEENSDDDVQFEEFWQCVGELETMFDIETYLAEDGEYSVRSSVKLKRGHKTVYRCKKAPKKGNQCARNYYTLSGYKRSDQNVENDTDNESLQNAGTSHDDANREKVRNGPFEIYFNNMPHTCDTLDRKSRQVPPHIKEKILSLKRVLRKPKAIALQLGVDDESSNDELPNLRQIRYVLEQSKVQEYGKGPLTMGELSKFANERMAIPEDDDEAFVVLFERSPSNLKPDDPNVFYRLFISTKRLLRESADATTLHADATKKITTDNNPLLVIGSTDKTKKFHLIGFTISSNETGAAYKMSFDAVKKGVAEVVQKDFKPKVLVADADPDIRNGFHATFGDNLPVVMCYAHVVRNVGTKYPFNTKENKGPLLKDLRILHNAYSPEIFQTGCDLFVDKWKTTEPRVIQLIQKSFIDMNNTWYIGYQFGVPTTDNALENFNGDIKQFQTDHMKKPLKQFLPMALTMIRQRSREYFSIPKPRFQPQVQIPDAVWESGLQFMRSFKSKVNIQDGIIEFHMFSSEADESVGHRDITDEDINDFKSAVYDSFDDFAKNAFRVHRIVFPISKDNWLNNTTCTCAAFDVAFVCKHIIHLAILHKLPLPERDTAEPNYDDMPLISTKASAALSKD